MRVTLIGAGRVGLTTALALEWIGHRVTCVDNSPAVVQSLLSRRLPFPDPALVPLLQRSGLEILPHLSPQAVSAEVVMIAVPTPPLPDGHADLSAVQAVARQVAELAPQGTDTVLAVKSTVPPGSADSLQELVNTILHQRGAPARISVASNPEFLRQGSALFDTLYPDRIIIGVHNRKSQGRLLELYEPILGQGFEPPPGVPRPQGCGSVPVICTTPVNAELIKYGANTFLATKLSFLNEMARLAERLGADIGVVARGIGLDHRIGGHYFQAGPGWGGPCLGKDARALLALAGDVGQEMPLLAAAVRSNALQREHVLRRLEETLPSLRGATIGLLGLSFKADTDDITDSPALEVASLLLRQGARVRAYDPMAEARAQCEFPHLALEYHDSVDDLCDGCDALLLMTDWAEFRNLPWPSLARRMRGRTVLDTRNLLDPQEIEGAGLTYIGLGR